jgi:hypothetical protein
LRFPLWMQAFIVLVIAAVLALVVTNVVDNWTDWIVLGGIVVAVVGTAIAINNRQYPTRKRAFKRDSSSKW